MGSEGLLGHDRGYADRPRRGAVRASFTESPRGPDLSAVTLARFFGTHVWILPAALGTLISTPDPVIRIGISGCAGEERALMNGKEKKEYLEGYKKAKEKGVPFFPEHYLQGRNYLAGDLPDPGGVGLFHGRPHGSRADPNGAT